jgi:phosphate uptake regulator
MFVAHNLERIGDRAVNLATQAQFAAHGALTNASQRVSNLAGGSGGPPRNYPLAFINKA